MKELDLFLKILQGSNLATPGLLAIIGAIKQGRAAGKTDDEIQEESMAIALRTKAKSEDQMSDRP